MICNDLMICRDICNHSGSHSVGYTEKVRSALGVLVGVGIMA
jgi:hypothetical protein